jgi:hypothetical protein
LRFFTSILFVSGFSSSLRFHILKRGNSKPGASLDVMRMSPYLNEDSVKIKKVIEINGGS